MGAGMACLREGSKGQKRRRDVGFCSSSKGGLDVVNAGVVGGRVASEHLVVMVNGIIGSATDWKFAAEQFVERLPKTVIVHRGFFPSRSECKSATLTFDGVDLMGERLAEEVLGVVRHWPGLQKISFVAHSLGGLVARYAIGRLYESVKEKNSWSEENSSHQMQSFGGYYKATIAGLEPMNFITFATPHLGSRGRSS
ncbi:putative lipase C4A8.10 [Drosera capensis]